MLAMYQIVVLVPALHLSRRKSWQFPAVVSSVVDTFIVECRIWPEHIQVSAKVASGPRWCR
jgi:hypothetical protein